jgi:hypothetical protein
VRLSSFLHTEQLTIDVRVHVHVHGHEGRLGGWAIESYKYQIIGMSNLFGGHFQSFCHKNITVVYVGPLFIDGLSLDSMHGTVRRCLEEGLTWQRGLTWRRQVSGENETEMKAAWVYARRT